MILCGGSGERLWPASRPERPKPFLRLLGAQSAFQETALRARPLVQGGELLVVGAARHTGLIREQLSAIGVEALALLEPEGRDTAPAIAAAAGWVAQRHPDALLAILPADHHIPDGEAFRAAITATLSAARDGGIVTLGLRPTGPSTAMGYIRAAAPGDGVRPIGAFVEKPDAVRAQALVAEGALWNSGIFVAAARTLLDEIARLAGEVAAASRAALQGVIVEDGTAYLGSPFALAPRIAFDRAVMERTGRGMVLPSFLEWSDLGSWDAVLAASERDAAGCSLGPGASAPASAQVLVRGANGMQVVVAGAERLAVVAEPDGVLVAGLDHAQAVRGAARASVPDDGSIRAPPGMEIAIVGAPGVIVVAAPDAVLVRGRGARASRLAPFTSLAEAAAWYGAWLDGWALPLWATMGADPRTGGFREALTWSGEPHDPRRRARVQARQTFVFASAAAEGRPGPWAAVARAGFDTFRGEARARDGLYASTLGVDGGVSDPEPRLYEHAFILLALSALARTRPGDPGPEAEAVDIVHRLEAGFRHGRGGFREAGEAPFQANAQMHLFEAALAWEGARGGPGWSALADELAVLALERFVDGATGLLHEFFDARWTPLSGQAGLVEPGHHFEWAWLLEQWGVARGRPDARTAARRLFALGRKAFDPSRGVVVNAVWPDLSVRDAGARLWPQTEHLKAALILGDRAAALQAANGLLPYLDTPQAGAWRERMTADGSFLDEPSPATSLYHLYLATRELAGFVQEP